MAKALEMAKAEGMDLIETVPGANPPVVKIMSFDKFRYQRAKELGLIRSEGKEYVMKDGDVCFFKFNV